jgi:hypothetical protein
MARTADGGGLAFKAPHYLAAARAAWRKAVRRKACFKRAGVSSMPLISRLVVLAGQALSIFFVLAAHSARLP